MASGGGAPKKKKGFRNTQKGGHDDPKEKEKIEGERYYDTGSRRGWKCPKTGGGGGEGKGSKLHAESPV